MKKHFTLKDVMSCFLMLVLICCISVSGIAQEMAIRGIVTDNSGSPLPGVSVLLKGTMVGTVTNVDGQYSIQAPSGNNILAFSFIGYASQEVNINGRTTINITMLEDAQQLEEIIVVGYGTQKKATLTGSVTSAPAEKITSSPAISLSNSLTGLLPGLTAINTTGQPGKNVSSILIRGQSTTGDNSPLVVVDGVPDETGAWQRINQNDIEQFSVLKDASAAIYGARAANGVILITTKRGSSGKPTLSYSFNQGVVVPTRLPELADSWDWAEYGNEYRKHYQNIDPLYTEEEIQIMRDGSDPINYPNTDWPKAVFKDYALQSMHNLSLRGGTESVRYSVSGSYSAENSMARNGLHEFDGYTLRTNIDADITDNITVKLDWNGGLDDIIAPDINRFGYKTSPLIPAYFPNGLPASTPSDNGYNPALNITGVGGYRTDKTQRNLVKASFDINVPQVKGLGVVGFYSYINEITEGKRWRDTWKVYNYDKSNNEYVPKKGGRVANPDLQQQFIVNRENLFNVRVTYETDFEGHNISGFVGAEQSEGSINLIRAYRKDFISGAIQELFAGSGENQSAYGTRNETARSNIIGRFSYNFQEKYLIDFNARYDGSYAFPKGKRWGFFPGVSTAWRLTEERFMEDNSFINDLKIRASYGKMGNDKIDPFQFLSLNSLNPIGTHFGGGVQGIVIPGVSPNPNITWEVATTTNIGMDALFLNEQLGFSVDLFKQRRENILTARTTEVPIYTGLVLPHENIGTIENKGIELNMFYRSKAGNNFSYSVSPNIAFAKNKIIDLSEPQDLLAYQKAEGGVIGAGLLYKSIGIFRTQEEVDSNPVMPGTRVGDLQYEDVNNDGKIDAADRVRVNKGTVPEITFGINTTLSYKDFSLYANFAGQARAWTYIFENGRPIYNIIEEIRVNRYTPGSMDSKYPWMPYESEPGEGEVTGAPSTFWLQNAAFVRLQTLQLGYNLPEDLISKLNLSSVQVYINGNNLLTFSDIKWYDPAGSTGNQGGVGGIEYSTGEFYPQTKIFNLGLNLTF